MAWYAAVKRSLPASRTASARPTTTDSTTTATANSVVL